MQAGYSLIVFPEATRSLDGSLSRFRAGTFMMAIEAGLPVVPVAVDGSRFVMRKGQLMTSPGHVRVTVLDPIPTAGRRPGEARCLRPYPECRRPSPVRSAAAPSPGSGGGVGVTLDLAPPLCASCATAACLAFDGVYRRRRHDHRLDAPFAARPRARLRRPAARRFGRGRAADPRAACAPSVSIRPKTRPSSEALLRRACGAATRLHRASAPSSISATGCSVEAQIAFGVYDRDRIAGGALALRLGADGEGYDGIRKGPRQRRRPP